MIIQKNLQEIINSLKSSEEYKENIVHWQTIEAKEAKLVEIPIARKMLRIHHKGQDNKSIRWMPWRQETMKDVVSCDKLRGAASRR